MKVKNVYIDAQTYGGFDEPTCYDKKNIYTDVEIENGIRIDYIFVDKFTKVNKSCRIFDKNNLILSDHYGVFAQIQ